MRAVFLGGDLRQKYACEYLIENNIYSEFFQKFTLDADMESKIKNASILILPMPISKDDINLINTNVNLYHIISLVGQNSIIFGGNFSVKLKDYIIQSGKLYKDYIDIESYQIQNSLLSAEGAIYYAKQRLDRSIYGAKIAVLGFGRIGKILSYLLHSQGAKITVCTRKDSDYIWGNLIGFDGFKIKISDNTSNLNLLNLKFDIIFNTIPYWIMDENFAKRINSDTMIIDIASKPFGMDEALVNKYHLKYYREPSIPGRYAPRSAGEIVGKTILNNINI